MSADPLMCWCGHFRAEHLMFVRGAACGVSSCACICFRSQLGAELCAGCSHKDHADGPCGSCFCGHPKEETYTLEEIEAAIEQAHRAWPRTTNAIGLRHFRSALASRVIRQESDGE